MSGLSQEQEEKRAAIQKSAAIWGGVAGVVVGLLTIWLLGGQGGAVRFGAAIAAAAGVGYLVFQASFKSGARAALCAKCGATFSISRSDHVETLTGSTEKDKREEQDDKSTKVTTWTEEALDVIDTYTCAKCGDVTTKAYKTTRRRDEKSVVEPFESPRNAAVKSGKGAGTGKKGGGKGRKT